MRIGDRYQNTLRVVSAHDFRGSRGHQSAHRVLPKSIKTTQRRQVAQAVLLILVAAGMLWGNVALFWLLGFPVTPTILFTVGLFVFGVSNWFGAGYETRGLLLPALALLLYEFVIHGVLGDGVGDPEWLRSFGLLTMCAGLLLVTDRLRISEFQLPILAKFVSWIAYLMGGLGVVQSVVSNTSGYFWNLLPEETAVSGAIAESDALRFAGLFRARGISSEYSYYGLGMVVLVTVCLGLLYLAPPDSKSKLFRVGALLMAISGVIVSASFAAWGVLSVTALFYVVASPTSLMRHKRTLLVSSMPLIAAVAILGPYLQGRLFDVLNNLDASATYRLEAAIDLIITPASDLASALVGTGVGLDATNQATWTAFQRHLSLDYLSYVVDDRGFLEIATGWAYVAVTMGWVGLALNGWLLAATFRKQGRRACPAIPLLALSLGYLFAVGSYLSPEWWALLALASVLRGIQTQ